MALYSYIKKESKISKKLSFKITLPKMVNFLSLVMIAGGFSMLLLVLLPLLKWQVGSPNITPENTLVRPIPNPEKALPPNQVLAKDREKDLTLASNWFIGDHKSANNVKIKEYNLSISKLGIENAKVMVGGEDLKKSLIHYAGTSIPGTYGNAVVFGHSVLPEFYDLKNYMTIFTKLPDLKIGDEIETTVDNVLYKYVVYDLETVDPTNISVLEQRYDNYYLSLITCVPPGLKWKRLVVRAKLQAPIEEETKTKNDTRH